MPQASHAGYEVFYLYCKIFTVYISYNVSISWLGVTAFDTKKEMCGLIFAYKKVSICRPFEVSALPETWPSKYFYREFLFVDIK